MNRLKSCKYKSISLLIALFLYSFQLFAKTVVISDIDDTLKQSNSVGKFQEKTYHFLRKVPYIDMRDMFNEIKENGDMKGEDVSFYYVSGAYSFTFKADKWLEKNQFPKGPAILKTLKDKESLYDFKHEEIKRILEAEKKSLDNQNHEELHVLMFGDNAQFDAVVYNNLTHEMNLDSHIYIRDVKAEATFFDSTLPTVKIPDVNYYFSEIELFADPEFDYLSYGLKARAYFKYTKMKLIPAYTKTTLVRRLDNLYNDKRRAKNDAENFWKDYHSRL